MRDKKKGSVTLVCTIVILLLVAASIFYFFYTKRLAESVLESTQTPSVEQHLVTPLKDADATVDLQNTLVTYLPSDAFAFLSFLNDSEGATRLRGLNKTDATRFESLLRSSPATKGLLSAFEKIGVNSFSTEQIAKFASESVVFLTPGGAGNNELVWGFIIRSTSEDLTEKTALLKEELKKAKEDISDFDAGSGQGFALKLASSDQPTEPAKDSAEGEIFCAALKNLAVCSSNSAVARKVLKAEAKSLPGFTKKEAFAQAMKGFPVEQERVVLGYLDVDQIVEAAHRSGRAEAVKIFKSGDLPIKGASFVSYVKDNLEHELRFLFDDSQTSKSSWNSFLNSSESEKIVSRVVKTPLIHLSLDAKTINKFISSLLKTDSQIPALIESLNFLEKSSRLAVIATSAPLGKSIMPLPDLLVIIETAQPNEALSQIQTLVLTSMAGNPALSSMKFTESDLGNGKKMNSLVSPFGMGVFLAADDQFAFVGSSEEAVRAAFAEPNTQSFINSLSAKQLASLAKEKSVANLYLNFPQLATLLENVGGLLSVYAPQGADAQGMLSDEKIQMLKTMGSFTGIALLEGNTLRLRSFYQEDNNSANSSLGK